MSEEKKKKGHRAYLNDFQKNIAGEYIYTGAHYAFEGEKRDWKKKLLRLWLYTVVMSVAVLAVGCIPVAGMMNTFYVILPFAATLASVFSVVWAMCRLSAGGAVLREYVYKATVLQVKPRGWLTVIFSGCAFVGECVFILLHRGVEHPLWSGMFLLIHFAILICALWWMKTAETLVWTKK